jgi:hypothetical protein
VTPDDVQVKLIEILGRRANARPAIKTLELSAGHAKADLERAFAVARATASGSVADRDAVALQSTTDLRERSIVAGAEFNYAKGLLSDLSDDQMAWQSILKKMLNEGA